jgi:hypothetical protein
VLEIIVPPRATFKFKLRGSTGDEGFMQPVPKSLDGGTQLHPVFFCGVGRPWLYFVDRCTNKSDCSGGWRDSRTDCLLLIDAVGSTRSCRQHGYLAATHHPPPWRIIRVHSNPIRNRLADTVLDSIRIRLVFARMDSRYLDSCPTLAVST